MNTNPGWTPERVAEMKRLWNDGLSFSQIAAQIKGVSRSAVIGKANRLGLTRPQRPGLIAASAPRVRYTPWTVERVALLRELWATEITREQIAARLGPHFTVNAVANKAADLRLPDRPRGPRPRLVHGGNNQIIEAGPDREPLAPPPKRSTYLALKGSNPKPFGERRLDECAWPITDPADTDGISRLSCCEPAPGATYCAHHAKLAYTPRTDKRRPVDLARALRRYL